MPELPVRAQLVDRILDGRLRQVIDAGRADGDSWETIARRIWIATNYPVTGVTVHAWHDAMSAPEGSDAA